GHRPLVRPVHGRRPAPIPRYPARYRFRRRYGVDTDPAGDTARRAAGRDPSVARVLPDGVLGLALVRRAGPRACTALRRRVSAHGNRSHCRWLAVLGWMAGAAGGTPGRALRPAIVAA